MSAMKRYIGYRLLSAIPVVLGVTIIVFSILHLTPGDPAIVILGDRITPEKLAELQEHLGLNQPIYIQYFHWLVSVLQGDFGTSIYTYQPVAGMIFERLGATLLLTITALVISVLIGIPIGVVSAVKQYSITDHASMAIALFWLSMPGFWLGLMLMLMFGLYLGWLPISGFFTLSSIILPTLTLGLPQIGRLARLTRSEMLEVLREDYVMTARAKGLTEYKVMYKHALRNAVISVVVLLFLSLPWLIGGAIVVETIFAWPGMGGLLFKSIKSKDFPVVQGIILIIALLTILSNLCGDIISGLLDPRIRYE